MNDLITQNFVELRSSRWQRTAGSLIFGVMAFYAVGAIVGALKPEGAWVKTEDENPLFLFVSGICLLAFSIFCWSRTERYRVLANHEGLIEFSGFRRKAVQWRDVAFYRIEPVRGTSERLMWPVMYGDDGRELFRPCFPFLIGSKSDQENRLRFWQFVERQLEGKART